MCVCLNVLLITFKRNDLDLDIVVFLISLLVYFTGSFCVKH